MEGAIEVSCRMEECNGSEMGDVRVQWSETWDGNGSGGMQWKNE